MIDWDFREILQNWNKNIFDLLWVKYIYFHQSVMSYVKYRIWSPPSLWQSRPYLGWALSPEESCRWPPELSWTQQVNPVTWLTPGSPLSTWQSTRWESLEVAVGGPGDSLPSSRLCFVKFSCGHHQDWVLLLQTWTFRDSSKHRTSARDWRG